MVRKEDSTVNLIAWKAYLMSKVEKILAWWKRWMFSFRVGMGYTGLMMALLIACYGYANFSRFYVGGRALTNHYI